MKRKRLKACGSRENLSRPRLLTKPEMTARAKQRVNYPDPLSFVPVISCWDFLLAELKPKWEDWEPVAVILRDQPPASENRDHRGSGEPGEDS